MVITINKLSGLQLLLQLQSTVYTTSYDAFVFYVIYLAFNDGYHVACQWSDKYVGRMQITVKRLAVTRRQLTIATANAL